MRVARSCTSHWGPGIASSIGYTGPTAEMTELEPARRYRFGVFEADAATGELRRQGIRIKLNAQPFQVLCMLLERHGELLTREEISRELWPDGTFVDYDHASTRPLIAFARRWATRRPARGLWRRCQGAATDLWLRWSESGPAKHRRSARSPSRQQRIRRHSRRRSRTALRRNRRQGTRDEFWLRRTIFPKPQARLC